MKFETGKTYKTSSICDSNCIYTMVVLSRTNKTIKALVNGDTIKTLRTYVFDNVETVRPLGSFSMCPIINANDLVEC